MDGSMTTTGKRSKLVMSELCHVAHCLLTWDLGFNLERQKRDLNIGHVISQVKALNIRYKVYIRYKWAWKLSNIDMPLGNMA